MSAWQTIYSNNGRGGEELIKATYQPRELLLVLRKLPCTTSLLPFGSMFYDALLVFRLNGRVFIVISYNDYCVKFVGP